MAAKIKLKKSSVSGNAPGTGDLEYGELAINYADGRLYYKNSSNVIKNFIDSDLLQATLSGVGGTGTVTSVAATVPTGFTVAGSPITSSGTLAVSYAAGYQGYTTTEASKLAGIEAGATGDQTASEILTAIKTVDGAASGLDADLLDGQQGSYYLNYSNLTNAPNVLDSADVLAMFSGGTGVTYTAATGTIAIGQDVSTADSPTFAGLTVNGDVSLSSGAFYKFGTGSVGFGDKAWDTVGLTSPAKWEFYRNTSTATLMIHQDDGSSNAELHLRSGTRDWVIANDTTDLSVICEGSEVLNVSAAGVVTSNGLTVDSDTLYVDPTNNRVGIGELTPEAQLHITASSGDTVLILEADPTNTNENDTPYIVFRADGSTGETAVVGLVGNSGNHATGTEANALLLEASGSRAVQIAPGSSVSAHFDYDGNVGIGTTSPSAKLDVVGNAELNGNLNVVGGEIQISGSAGTAGQVLTSNGSGSAPSWQDAAGGITYVRKTANYTASAGEGVIADTSAGSWTLTLPASPTTGDVVVVADGDDWSTNNLTIARNGSFIEGADSDMLMDVAGASVTFLYDSAEWEVYVQGASITAGGGGATGGGTDEIFWENGQNVTTNYTITNGKNAMSAGPITVDSGVTVTIGAGEVWTVV